MSALTLVAMLVVAPHVHAQDIPQLTTDPVDVSDDGTIRLDWNATDQEKQYEVQQASENDFTNAKQVYDGPDLAVFISGLRNGTYYFRVREEGQNWSNVKKVTVQHHSLRLAFFLFGIGALVFLLTAWVVIRGAYQTNAIG